MAICELYRSILHVRRRRKSGRGYLGNTLKDTQNSARFSQLSRQKSGVANSSTEMV